MNRRLVVLRHAEAGHAPGAADRDRPLTDRGRLQAQEAGGLLADAGLLPDHVICSTALRTRQTLELALGRMGREPSVDLSGEAYSADLDTMFELIGLVGGDVRTLLVVGHNPTAAQLASSFTEGPALVPFPPASVAAVDLDVDWLYAAPGTGTARILGPGRT